MIREMAINLSDLEDVFDIREEDVMKVGSGQACIIYYVMREMGINKAQYHEDPFPEYFIQETFNSLVRNQPKYVYFVQKETRNPGQPIRTYDLLKSVKFSNSDEEVPLTFQDRPVTLSRPIPQENFIPLVYYAGSSSVELEIETIYLPRDTRKRDLESHYRNHPETLSSKRRLRHFKLYAVLVFGLTDPAFSSLMVSLEKSFGYPGLL